MNKLLSFLGLFGLVAFTLAEEPRWKEIEAMARAGDLARLESWVKENGINSGTAANALIAAVFA